MKSRNELFLVVLILALLIIVRSLYTVSKPKLDYGAEAFSRESLIQLVNDPKHPRKVTVFLITPTYSRYTQKADLVRLCSTLTNLDFIHWIVIEDAQALTP